MRAFEGFARLFAFVACVALCNLAAAARSEPAEPGRRYLSQGQNLRLHIIWTAIGMSFGLLFVLD